MKPNIIHNFFYPIFKWGLLSHTKHEFPQQNANPQESSNVSITVVAGYCSNSVGLWPLISMFSQLFGWLPYFPLLEAGNTVPKASVSISNDTWQQIPSNVFKGGLVFGWCNIKINLWADKPGLMSLFFTIRCLSYALWHSKQRAQVRSQNMN